MSYTQYVSICIRTERISKSLFQLTQFKIECRYLHDYKDAINIGDGWATDGMYRKWKGIDQRSSERLLVNGIRMTSSSAPRPR